MKTTAASLFTARGGLPRALRRSAHRAVSVGALGITSVAALRLDAATVRTPTDVDSACAFTAQLGREISLRQAIDIALKRHPGRVLRAETTRHGESVVHEIRILSDNSYVRTVRIDAETARFL